MPSAFDLKSDNFTHDWEDLSDLFLLTEIVGFDTPANLTGHPIITFPPIYTAIA